MRVWTLVIFSGSTAPHVEPSWAARRAGYRATILFFKQRAHGALLLYWRGYMIVLRSAWELKRIILAKIGTELGRAYRLSWASCHS
jgi:hypothetical protein